MVKLVCMSALPLDWIQTSGEEMWSLWSTNKRGCTHVLALMDQMSSHAFTLLMLPLNHS